MTEPLRNRTAAGVAWLRAVHQLLDGQPRILDDPAIVTLLGPQGVERLHAESDRASSKGARGLRVHVVLRSRVAEDHLRLSIDRGVTQYVLLGAGYDTFIVRQPEWARALHIVEVDRPAIQEEKYGRLADAGLVVSDNVQFAPIDFENETLAQGLARNGVSLDRPTFFSWLGVTMYLTEAAIDATLRTVVATPPGSEIVFTYADPTPHPDSVMGAPRLADLAASVGEPWLSYFTPDVLEQKLRAFGFGEVEFVTPEMVAGYFSHRTDELEPPRRVSIVSARVTSRGS